MDLAGCGAADSIPFVHHYCWVCQGRSRHSTGAYVCPLPLLLNVIHTKWGFNLFLRQEELMHDPRITMYMLSLPNKGPASSVPTRPASTSATTPSTVQPKKKARPSKKNRTAPTPPDELKGCYQHTSDNKPICWSYNLKNGCSLEASGQPPKCRRGVHICAFCRKTGHSFQQCKAAPGKSSPH